jgi:hypothetical protein
VRRENPATSPVGDTDLKLLGTPLAQSLVEDSAEIDLS